MCKSKQSSTKGIQSEDPNVMSRNNYLLSLECQMALWANVQEPATVGIILVYKNRYLYYNPSKNEFD